MPKAVKKTISLPPDLAAEAEAQAEAEGKTLLISARVFPGGRGEAADVCIEDDSHCAR